VPPPPTTSPSAAPQPTTSPQPSIAGEPNLVVTKFTLESDTIAVNQPSNASITVKNIGSADAGPFDVQVSYQGTEPSHGGIADAQRVDDGLPANSSVQLTITITLSDADSYSLSAIADANVTVAESNEDDNQMGLQVEAIDLPNLYFVEAVTFGNSGGGETFITFKAGNSGTADASGVTFQIFCYDDAGERTDLGDGRLSDPLAAGGSDVVTVLVHLPTSNTYDFHVLLDPANSIEESNESDNDGELNYTVP
jgi:subtilase family serine protease